MKMTLESLIIFLQKYYQEKFSGDTILRSKSIDGDDAVELLILLEKNFKANFNDFDFKKYFLEEIEISKGLSWFGLIRNRKIQTELTVNELFKYMSQNRIN